MVDFGRFKYIMLFSVMMVIAAENTLAVNIRYSFSNIFSQFNNFLQSPAIRAGLVLIAFFIVLLGIFTTAMKRLPLFRDNDRQLRVVAAGFGIIGTLGFFFASGRNFYQTVETVLKAMGIFGTLLVSIICAMVFYFLFNPVEGSRLRRSTSVALIAIGIGLVLFGTLAP